MSRRGLPGVLPSMLAAVLLCSGPAGAQAQVEPRDSVEEEQLLEMELLVRAVIQAQENRYVEQRSFAGSLGELPGLEVPPEVHIRVSPAGDGYDLRVSKEEVPFICSFKRRLKILPGDPPDRGRILCVRRSGSG